MSRFTTPPKHKTRRIDKKKIPVGPRKSAIAKIKTQKPKKLTKASKKQIRSEYRARRIDKTNLFKKKIPVGPTRKPKLEG